MYYTGTTRIYLGRVTPSKPKIFVLTPNKRLSFWNTSIWKPWNCICIYWKGCISMKTLCAFIFVDNTTIYTSNHSDICVCNFTKIIGCNFNYSTPVTSYQLLQSNYILTQDLLPIPTGMNLTLLKKLLQHDDLCQLLTHTQNNGRKTLFTFHHDSEETH